MTYIEPHMSDIFQVRNARVRIIELRNDLKTNTDDLAKALEIVYARGSQPDTAPVPELKTTAVPTNQDAASVPGLPFAKVNGVAPGSPAAEAVSV